ncbi:hypothetical protein GSS88_07365 [Corynebacterium sp. 3HC-13]|uniref:CGLAU_01105 family protein n=1 Tax=Corynebacterium poyangense TaxID=2684405 RepID=UPI001CCE3D30|nr:CGLAU_01105 family protein [Corynebacterium poyangense]MBZ8177609.1 hypothetical protein [Corynebacterium poyangense]
MSEENKPSKVWSEAAQQLKNVVGEFKDHYQKESPGRAEDSALEKLKSAGKEARDRLIDARSAEELKSAVKDFMEHSGDAVKQLGDTVQRAARETKDSPAVDQARASLSDAFATSKNTVQEKVKEYRERRHSQGDNPPPTVDGEVISDHTVEDQE